MAARRSHPKDIGLEDTAPWGMGVCEGCDRSLYMQVEECAIAPINTVFIGMWTNPQEPAQQQPETSSELHLAAQS